MRYLIPVLLLCLISQAVTQTENKKINCDNDCTTKELPFLFCDMATGRKITKCTADPNHEPGLRALRKRMPPTCYSYNAASFTLLQPGYAFVQISGGDTTILFAPDWVDGAIFTAAIDWWLQSGCPSPQTDDVDNCCINATWAQRREELFDFRNKPEAVLAMNWNEIRPTAGAPDCKVDCNKSGLIFNQTPEFTRLNVNSFPTRFFYNGGEEPDGNGSLSNGDDYEYYHFPSVLMHETGHWYGIGHLGEADAFGRSCGDQSGASMMSGGNNGGGLYPGEERTLRNDDLCAFRKLYCCEQTAVGVEEKISTGIEEFSIYPNPLHTSILAVEVSSQQLILHGKTVRLIDGNGRIVYEAALPAGSTIHTINTDGLPTGSYLVTITADGLKGAISKRILIER